MTIPDTDLTSTLDPKLRKASLEDLLTRCLQARSATEPLVVVLEDCHWIDPLSRDLLEVLVRAAAALPVLFVVTYRPAADPGGGLGLARLPHFAELALDELAPEDAELLIQSKLAQLFGEGTAAPAALVELVTTRAQGNPFYVEELLNYLRATGVDMQDESKLRRLEAPESLHSLILSRIDTLEESQRRTLKVASVLGRSFRASVLPGVYPELGSIDDVRDDLRELRVADLVSLDREAEEAYIFKHVVTEEVTYESLPFATRAMLHDRTGDYIEATEADTIDQQLDLLAYHYWRSQNTDKKRHYLVRAGKAAQASYANAAAIDYYERVAPLLARARAHRRAAQPRQGHRADGRLAACRGRRARGLAGRRADRRRPRPGALRDRPRRGGATAGTVRRGGVVAGVGGRRLRRRRRRGWGRAGPPPRRHPRRATGRLRRRPSSATRGAWRSANGSTTRRASAACSPTSAWSPSTAVTTSSPSSTTSGRSPCARSSVIAGRSPSRSPTSARSPCSRRTTPPPARASRRRCASTARSATRGWWRSATTTSATPRAASAITRPPAATTRPSLRAYRDYDDAWAVAFLLEDIAELAAMLDQPARAFELVGAADALRAEIGAPRAPASEQHLEATIAEHAASLDPDERAACRESGRRLDADGAFRLALAVCGPGADNH